MVWLIEFARNASDIKRTLIDRTPMIVEHILKLVIDPNNSARNHWIQEIYSFLKEIDIAKSTKKLPKESFIYNNSYGAVRDRVNTDRYVKARVFDIEEIDDIYTNKSISEIRETLDTICLNYFTWLSKSLSKSGIVTHREVRSVIDKLLDDIE